VLARIPPTHRVDAGYQAGLYSPRMKELTYRSLLDGALEGLDAGRSVIVDATFSRRAWRAPFVDAAARLGLPYFVLHVTADDRVVRERLARREHDAGEASDAGLDVYLAERAAFEPPVEVPREHLLDPVSGEGGPEEQGSTLVDRMIALQPGG
jgi:predicted kinase